MYEGFLVDVYVSVVVMLALVALYLASGKPVQKKRTGSVVPLLHGSSKPCITKDIPRSKVVYVGMVSIEGAPYKPVYMKEYMLK